MAGKETKVVRDFTSGNIVTQLLAFSAPLFLSNLLQVVYNMVDMLIVGQHAGSVGLSAISVGGDIASFMTFLVMGFSNAGQVIIAQYIGAKQPEKIGKFVGTMMTFLTGCAIVGSVGVMLFRGPILSVMNTPAESWDYAYDYITICTAGLVFVYGYNIVSAVLRGYGDSKHPFVFISIASVLNVILDLLFVMKFEWGAAGAALATVISQTVSFLYAMVFIYRARGELGIHFSKRDFHPDREMLLMLVKLGIPMAIKNASVQMSKLFVNSWINSYGVLISAVSGVNNKLSVISNLFSNAVNAAASSMIGQNIGAEKYGRVPKIMKTTFAAAFCMIAVLAGILAAFPEQVYGIFTSDKSVLPIAAASVPIVILVFLGSAFRCPMNALLNGSGNYKVNFAVAILDGIVLRIGLSLLFGVALEMEYMGFWLGDALASFTPFVIGIVYYKSGRWKSRRFVIKE